MTRYLRAILLVATLLAVVACGSDDSSDATTAAPTRDEAATSTDDTEPETTDRVTTTTELETTTTTTEPPQDESITWTQANGSEEYPLTLEFTASVSGACSVSQESASRWSILTSGCLSVSAVVIDAPFGAGGLASQGGIPLPNIAVLGTLDGTAPGSECTESACAQYPIGTYVPSDETCPNARPAFVCEGSAWEYPIDDLTMTLAPSSKVALAQYDIASQADGVGQTITLRNQVGLLGDGVTIPGDVATAALCEWATVGGCA